MAEEAGYVRRTRQSRYGDGTLTSQLVNQLAS